MEGFTGAALYHKVVIESALHNYKREVDELQQLLDSKYKDAEEIFLANRSWWDKFTGKKRLTDKYSSMFGSKYESAYLAGMITFTEEEEGRLENVLSYYFPFGLGSFQFTTEYNQVKALFGNGKDCYLNPNQARFVNKWCDPL